MAFKLAVKCDLLCAFLRCGFPKDAIDEDLRVSTLKGIHTCKKDYKTQNTQYSPWRAQFQDYTRFRRKMKEFLNRPNKINTQYAHNPIRHNI